MDNYNDDYYQEKTEMQPAYRAHPQEFGCEFCWDNHRKQDIELYFFDRANNLRLCNYCPVCGRTY